MDFEHKLNSLLEGIRSHDPSVFDKAKQGNYIIDFSKDAEGDFVKLTGINNFKTLKTDFYEIVIYYSFELDINNIKRYYSTLNSKDPYTDITTATVAADLVKYLKSNNTHTHQPVRDFISYSADHFVGINSEKIDLITFPESSSQFNDELANEIASRLPGQPRVVGDGIKKMFPSNVTIDSEGLEKYYKERNHPDVDKLKTTINGWYKGIVARIDKYNNELTEFFDSIGKPPQLIDLNHNVADQYMSIIKTMASIRKNRSGTPFWDWGEIKNYPKTGRARDKLVGKTQLYNIKNLSDQYDIIQTLNQIMGDSDIDQSQSSDVIDLMAEFWAKKEADKLYMGRGGPFQHQRSRVTEKPYKIKNIISKNKRKFVNFLQNSEDLDTSGDDELTVLIIDDNIDSGATFSIIDRLIGGLPGVNKVLYYSPLAMSVSQPKQRTPKQRTPKPKRKTKSKEPMGVDLSDFSIGTLVQHPVHGKGEIVFSSPGFDKAKVQFQGGRQKISKGELTPVGHTNISDFQSNKPENSLHNESVQAIANLITDDPDIIIEASMDQRLRGLERQAKRGDYAARERSNIELVRKTGNPAARTAPEDRPIRMLRGMNRPYVDAHNRHWVLEPVTDLSTIPDALHVLYSHGVIISDLPTLYFDLEEGFGADWAAPMAWMQNVNPQEWWTTEQTNKTLETLKRRVSSGFDPDVEDVVPDMEIPEDWPWGPDNYRDVPTEII